jgi:four helix bundle protein
MAAIRDFEEIRAWQLAIDLTKRIHATFKTHRDLTFRDQILRASYSIANNIAEGFDRGSNKDFRRFLRIARGSCNEVRSMTILAREIGYLKAEEVESWRNQCRHISATIQALIASMHQDKP